MPLQKPDPEKYCAECGEPEEPHTTIFERPELWVAYIGKLRDRYREQRGLSDALEIARLKLRTGK